MEPLHVGISQVHLLFRYSRSLKDKRQILSSLTQKLRNEGFSVTEVGFAEDMKQGTLGFAFAGKDRAFVENKQLSTRDIFLGDFQISQFRHEIVDFSLEDGITSLSWEEEEFK